MKRLALLLLFAATPAQAADLSHWAYWGATGADLWTTGAQREANPLLKSSTGGLNRPAFIAINSGVYALTLRAGPKQGKKARLIVAAIHAGVSVWNIRQSRQGRMK